MPITIKPLSRRQFLKYTAAGAVGLIASQLKADSVRPWDPHRFALLSDTHINADPMTIEKECNMSDRFAVAVKQIFVDTLIPCHAFVNGDCAHRTGETGDYEQFLKISSQLSDHGVPVSCALGNHDNRDLFFKAIPKNGNIGSASRLVEDKQLLLVKSDRVNWLVLDTLDATSKTPGRLGDKQIAMIAKTLDDPQVNNKPVLIMMHHNPEPTADPAATEPAKGIIGLLDTKLLYDLIIPQKCVKAVFHGHTHRFEHKQYEGIHMVNLPAIGYPFDKAQPTGWLDFYVQEKGAKARLMTIDPADTRNGDQLNLEWR